MEQRIQINKAALQWIVGLTLSLLGGAFLLVWNASAKLTNIETRLAGLEKQQERLLETSMLLTKDITFIRAGMIGPLRSTTSAGSNEY